MAWQNPKINWEAANVVTKDDFNRIEGRLLAVLLVESSHGVERVLDGDKSPFQFTHALHNRVRLRCFDARYAKRIDK